MKDDIHRDLKSLTRQRLRLIWEMAQMVVVPDDGDAVLIQALWEHPEYYWVWDQVDELSDEELIQDTDQSPEISPSSTDGTSGSKVFSLLRVRK
jgi:hypothetical protein